MDDLAHAITPQVTNALDSIQRGQEVNQVLGAVLVLAIIGLGVMFLFSRRDQKTMLEIVRGQNAEMDTANNGRVDRMLEASNERFRRVEAAIDSIEKRLDDIKDRLRDFGLQVIAVYREAMGLTRKHEDDHNNGEPKP